MTIKEELEQILKVIDKERINLGFDNPIHVKVHFHIHMSSGTEEEPERCQEPATGK